VIPRIIPGNALKVFLPVFVLLVLPGLVSFIGISLNRRIAGQMSLMRETRVVPMMSALGAKKLSMRNARLVRYALYRHEADETALAERILEQNRKKIDEFAALCASHPLTCETDGGAEKRAALGAELREKQDEAIAIAKSGRNSREMAMRLGSDGDITALENNYLIAMDTRMMELAILTNRDIARAERTAERGAVCVAAAAVAALSGTLAACALLLRQAARFSRPRAR